jgi:hypothetical protein
MAVFCWRNCVGIVTQWQRMVPIDTTGTQKVYVCTMRTDGQAMVIFAV